MSHKLAFLELPKLILLISIVIVLEVAEVSCVKVVTLAHLFRYIENFALILLVFALIILRLLLRGVKFTVENAKLADELNFSFTFV